MFNPKKKTIYAIYGIWDKSDNSLLPSYSSNKRNIQLLQNTLKSPFCSALLRGNPSKWIIGPTTILEESDKGPTTILEESDKHHHDH